MAGHVYGFPDEEQSGNGAGFQGAGVKGSRIDAASRYLGFFVAFCANRKELPVAEPEFGRFERCIRPAGRRSGLCDVLSQALGQRCAECLSIRGVVPAAAGFKQTLQYSLARGLPWSEIDMEGLPRLPIRGRLQDGWTAESAMGDQHLLPEARRGTAAVWRAGPGENFSGDTAERRPSGFVAAEHQGHERGAGRNNSQAELAGEVVCETGRAKFRYGEATDGDHERGGAQLACCGKYVECSSRLLDAEIAGVQDKPDPCAFTLGQQHIEEVAGGMIAEKLAEGLLVPGDAVALDKLDEVMRRVEGECGLGEMRIGRKKAVRRAVDIGEIAPASAGDENLAAGLGVVVEQDYPSTTPAGDGCAHQTCGAGSQNNYIAVLSGGSGWHVFIVSDCSPKQERRHGEIMSVPE